MITTIQITDDFITTVEISENPNSNRALNLSHGLGVWRDIRGSIINTVHNLRQDFLYVTFNYTQVLLNNDMEI